MNDLIDRNEVARCLSILMGLRCKNCKYWDKDWQTIEGCRYCCMIDMQTEGEFFCAKGERREDGDENYD